MPQTEPRRRALVVDDDQFIRESLALYLSDRHWDVTTASDGGEALLALAAGGFAVVLLDLFMPRITGWQVLEEKARDPSSRAVPVIVLTAHYAGDTRLTGVTAVLTKPVDLAQLDAALAHVGKHG